MASSYRFAPSTSLLHSTSSPSPSSSSTSSSSSSSSSRGGRARFFSSLPPPSGPVIQSTSWWNPFGGGAGSSGSSGVPPGTDATVVGVAPPSSSSNPDMVSFPTSDVTTFGTDAATSTMTSLPSLLESPPFLSDAASVLVSNPSLDFGWYNPCYQIMETVEWVHLTLDIPYFGAIVASTLFIRLVMLPVALRTQRNSSRFAHMKPEMEHLQKTAVAQADFRTNPKVQAQMQAHMQALFKKYDCNPVRSLMFPILQLPVFMSFFFALKEMHLYFPGLETGGFSWVTDLSVSDPYLILPIACSASFLLMLELGADGMAATSTPEKTAQMKLIFRILGVSMVPLTMSMPASVFMYWCTSNAFSVVQVGVMRIPGVKQSLGIWDPPAAPLPVQPDKLSWKSIMENARKKADEIENRMDGAAGKGAPLAPSAAEQAAKIALAKAAKEQLTQSLVFREEPKKNLVVDEMDLAKTLQKKRK